LSKIRPIKPHFENISNPSIGITSEKISYLQQGEAAVPPFPSPFPSVAKKNAAQSSQSFSHFLFVRPALKCQDIKK
jgi:hypothetical protein